MKQHQLPFCLLLACLWLVPVSSLFEGLLCSIGIGCEEEAKTAFYFAELDPSQNVHTSCDTTPGRGSLVATYADGTLCFRLSHTGITGETNANIRGPALLGENGPILFNIPLGAVKRSCLPVQREDAVYLAEGKLYVNITTSTPGCTIGEVRGQILPLG